MNERARSGVRINGRCDLGLCGADAPRRSSSERGLFHDEKNLLTVNVLSRLPPWWWPRSPLRAACPTPAAAVA
jgi:hypothetical protein